MKFARALRFALLLAACAAPAIARGGDPERPLLLRLADEKDPGHEAALKEWAGLVPPARLAILREGLRSQDAAVALIAARATDPDVLSNDEIRRQMEILLHQPDVKAIWRSKPYAWSQATPIPASIGAADMVAFWRALASLPNLEPGDELPDLHRTMLPEHIEALVPLLETAGPEVFGALLGVLELVADHIGGDAHRSLLARAFLYAQERWRADRDKKPRPKLESIAVDVSGPGLPPAFVALARVGWGLDDPDGIDPGQVQGLRSYGPHYWLANWAKTLVPEAKDVPFLLELVQAPSPKTPETARAWGVRKLEPFYDADGVRKVIEELAAEKDETSVFAAAALAKKGKPDRWREMLEKGDATARLLEWEMDPEKARFRWFGALVAEGAHIFPPGLGALTRAEAERDWGVVIRDEDVRWIADRLVAPEVPPPNFVDFFTEVAPEFVTPAAAARMAVALRDLKDDEWNATNWTIEPCALLEAYDPKALHALLEHWLETKMGHDLALILLARIGDTGHVPAMTESWPRWHGLEMHVLGRVRDPRVEEFLVEKVASKDEYSSLAALHALAIFRGLPELRHTDDWPSLPEAKDDEEAHAKALADVQRQVLAADPIGAAVDHIVRTEELASYKDPRALDLLHRLRRDRFHETSPAYWSATAGLAAADDPEAKREYEEFLRDGRTWMLDSGDWEAIAFTRAHPEWIDFWVDRLESNCCTAFQAYAVLNNIYPTMPIEHFAADGGLMKSIAKKWLAKHRGSFVWSKILDAWVPSN